MKTQPKRYDPPSTYTHERETLLDSLRESDPKLAAQIDIQTIDNQAKALARRHAFLKAFAGAQLALMLIGAILGKFLSPVYTDPTSGPQHMSKFLGKHASYGRYQFGGFGGASITCGLRSYHYSFASRIVTTTAVIPSSSRNDIALLLRNPIPSLDVALGALVGSLTTFNAQTVYKTIAASWKHGDHKPAIMAGAISGVFIGLVLGFWWSYEPIPRCGDPTIAALLRDPDIWSASVAYRSK